MNTIDALYIELPRYKSETMGFFHSGGAPIMRGWWEWPDGEEGGELHVDIRTKELVDFDGNYNAPKHVISELAELGITCE